MRPFHPLFRNPHLATLAGNFWRRTIDVRRFPTRAVVHPTEPGTSVLVHENRPPGRVRGEVLLLHGLEGSSSSGYMVSLAQALCEQGYAAHRVNIRSCGSSEHLTPTLYHSGLTADLRILLERFRAEGRGPLSLCGFSLGGNVVLKLVAELGDQVPGLLQTVVAVSTPLDLAASVRRIDAPENWLYQKRFVLSLCRRYRRRHTLDPARFPLDGIGTVHTIYGFDDLFTAPHFGFGTADNYYATQSSFGFLPAIRLPVLLVQAEDDPMIPFHLFEDERVSRHPWIHLLAVPHGGHLGFISRTRPRFWLDGVILDWIGAEWEQPGPGSRLG